MKTPEQGLHKKMVIGFGLVLAGLLSCATAQAAAITLSSTDFPPYTGAKLPQEGIITAITQAAFKRAGYQVHIQYRPWARSLQEAKTGLSDGILSVWRSKEREAFFAYSKPLYANKIGFYARTDNPVDLQDLPRNKKLRVGVVRGYVNPPAFEAAKLQTEEATSDEENLLKLAAGRVDVVLVDKGLAAYLLNDKLETLRGRVNWVEPTVDTLPLYVAFSKSSPGWQKRLDDFNNGLEALRKDGSLSQLQRSLGY